MNASQLATRANIDARLQAVRDQISSDGMTAVLVLDTNDVRWLTGLQSSNVAVVVTNDACVVATDFRYVSEARSLGLDVQQLDQALYSALGKLAGQYAGNGPIAYPPASLSHRAFLQFTDSLPDACTLRANDTLVSDLRAIKDSDEIRKIERAAQLLTGAYEMVQRDGLLGRSEGDVAWQIERYLRDNGAQRMSFDSIVAGGENGSRPHHTPAGDEIPNNTLVTIDIGCVVDGYCSDCTRTFAVGQPNDQLMKAYDVTLRAQELSLAAVTAGAKGADIDQIARDLITAEGHGEHFGHGLGHGVGIEVHEGPRLSRTSDDVLQAGMVVTVEPGIYIPEVGGVRIEDLAVVTDGAPQVLTDFTKQLTTVS